MSMFKKFYALGTILQFQVDGQNAEKAIEEAMDTIRDIEEKMSVFINDSEISRVNRNAGGLPQKVSSNTYLVMRKALKYSYLSHGAFDPTIRPVVNLWGFGSGQNVVPLHAEIQEKLQLVDYKDIILDDKNRTLKLRRKNQALDAGGIAKGFAADRVKDVFQKYQIPSAIINLGGNIFALGQKNGQSLWGVGIQNPYGLRDEFIGAISVANKSIVTSGNYERYFISNGKRFHHIIDPRTGYPSENGVISTTIITDSSIDADALSTCAYVMGLNEGMKFIETLANVEAIFVTDHKEIFVTRGIKDNFVLLNMEFTYEHTDRSIANVTENIEAANI